MAPSIFDKGVEGKRSADGLAAAVDKDGKVLRPSCKFVVVLQPDASDEAQELFHAANEPDAQEYVKAMRIQGQAKGLRVVKAGNGA